MKNYLLILVTTIFIFSSCSKEDGVSSSDISGATSSSTNSSGNQTGIITAGEWNDIENWDFWLGLQTKKELNELADTWKMFTDNRIAVLVKNGNTVVANANIELRKNNVVVWSAKSDNLGTAQLWIGFDQKLQDPDLSNYTLLVNGTTVQENIKLIDEGVNEIQTNTSTSQNSIELAFIVDATGSMGDEIDFLKDDLKDVLQRVKNENSNQSLRTATVFYRDEGDDYVVKKSNFTNDVNSTIAFINKQWAAGGGDFPEAVHSGINEAINNLQWSQDGKTKIAFLLLDAPPHHTSVVINNLQQNVIKAAKNGIKIIPITASGINKETEFLMRYLAMVTNGTYVFITNDSGVGDDHIEATVGPYQVEFLNNLLVRLVSKYAQ